MNNLSDSPVFTLVGILTFIVVLLVIREMVSWFTKTNGIRRDTSFIKERIVKLERMLSGITDYPV